MKAIFIGVVICILIAVGIVMTIDKNVNAEQPKDEIEQSKMAASELAEAIKQAEAENPDGLLKLYDIATNDPKFTVEYSEAAQEQIYLFLYSKTELWIKTFSKADLGKFKTFVQGIDVSQLPEGVSSDEEFRKTIFQKLEKIRGDDREMELIHHIFRIYNHRPV